MYVYMKHMCIQYRTKKVLHYFPTKVLSWPARAVRRPVTSHWGAFLAACAQILTNWWSFKYSQFCKYSPVIHLQLGQNGIKTHLMIVYAQKNPRKCCERIPVEFSPGLDPAMCSRPRKSKTCFDLPEWGRGLGPGMMSGIRFLMFDVRQLCQVRAWSLTRAGNLWLGLSMSSDGLTVVFKVPARETKVKLLKSKS